MKCFVENATKPLTCLKEAEDFLGTRAKCGLCLQSGHMLEFCSEELFCKYCALGVHQTLNGELCKTLCCQLEYGLLVFQSHWNCLF